MLTDQSCLRKKGILVGGPVVSEMMVSSSSDRVVAHGFAFCSNGSRQNSLGESLHPLTTLFRLITFHQRDRQTLLRVAEGSDVISFARIFTVAKIVANTVIDESSHGLIAVVFDGVEEVGGDSDFFPWSREEWAMDVGPDGSRSANVASHVWQLLQIMRLSVGDINKG